MGFYCEGVIIQGILPNISFTWSRQSCLRRKGGVTRASFHEWIYKYYHTYLWDIRLTKQPSLSIHILTTTQPEPPFDPFTSMWITQDGLKLEDKYFQTGTPWKKPITQIQMRHCQNCPSPIGMEGRNPLIYYVPIYKYFWSSDLNILIISSNTSPRTRISLDRYICVAKHILFELISSRSDTKKRFLISPELK